MSLSALPLDQLQRWLQAVVVQPGRVQDAVASPAATLELPVARIGDVILPSQSLDSVERLGIYQGMYLLRMEEALASDYLALQHFLGNERFLALVRDYVQAHPSRSFSLNHLGAHLPEFVASAPVPHSTFCHDLARLELALTEVFDGEESPSLSAEQIAAVPDEAWERARLRPVSAFRLLAFDYAVGDYLDSFKDEEHRHPGARKKASWGVVYRRDYSVFRLDLSRGAYDLLRALTEGATVGEAVAGALSGGGRRKPSVDDLFRWFRQWVSAGVFQAVEI